MRTDFTTEEPRMIHRIRRRDRRETIGGSLLLLPFAAFSVDRLAHHDAIAAFIARVGMATCLLWWLAASARSQQALRAIVVKCAAPAAGAESPDRGGGG